MVLTPFKEHDPNIVKIGIDAPKSVRVNREEVQLEIEADVSVKMRKPCIEHKTTPTH